MDSHEELRKHHALLKNLSHIPERISSFHGTGNVPEFVLHELCHERCFNLRKVAYLVDNPDFHILKGIVGATRQDGGLQDNFWQTPDQFISLMQNCAFNKKVRSLELPSIRSHKSDIKEVASDIAHELGMHDHIIYTWPMRYENHGLLLVEASDDHNILDEDYLQKSLHLLSMCPIH